MQRVGGEYSPDHHGYQGVGRAALYSKAMNHLYLRQNRNHARWCCSHCGTLLRVLRTLHWCSTPNAAFAAASPRLACADCVMTSAPLVCDRARCLQLPDRADGNVMIQFQSCEAANFWATGYATAVRQPALEPVGAAGSTLHSFTGPSTHAQSQPETSTLYPKPYSSTRSKLPSKPHSPAGPHLQLNGRPLPEHRVSAAVTRSGLGAAVAAATISPHSTSGR